MSPTPVVILLADDSEDDILMVQRAFQREEIANPLHVVRDGEETLAYLRRQPPHENARPPGLLLLDINMPKKDGFQVLQEIKSDPELQHLPVIMLTTSTREEDVVRSYRAGACSYVSKPVDFEELRQIIKQFGLYWAIVSRVPQAGGT